MKWLRDSIVNDEDRDNYIEISVLGYETRKLQHDRRNITVNCSI